MGQLHCLQVLQPVLRITNSTAIKSLDASKECYEEVFEPLLCILFFKLREC